MTCNWDSTESDPLHLLVNGGLLSIIINLIYCNGEWVFQYSEWYNNEAESR